MADNHVITIARQYGSGGRIIGQMLAKDLGWNFYDKELVQMASDESGIREDFFEKADEAKKPGLTFRAAGNVFDGRVISPESSDFTSRENLFRYQAKIIRRLAETENCVIMGRCSDYVLKNYSNVVKVYVHAPYEVCIRAVMQRDGLLQEDAIKRIKEIDKQRSDYYKHFTGESWKNADHYDLCLDSSRLGYEKCLTLVKAYLNSL